MPQGIKIIHLMKDCANPNGIPNFPYFIPLLLEEKGYYNYILLTRNPTLPKVKPRRDLPLIKHIPSKIKVIKEVISQRPDILIIYHHFGSPLAFVLLLISKILKCKTIAQPDFNEYGIPKRHKSIQRTIKDIFRWVLIVLQLILFDRIVCATEYEINVLSQIRRVSEDKYCIIPWGTEFEVKTSRKENYILTVSKWWRYRKNLHTILKVFSEVIKERPCKLVIVGKFFEGKDDEVERMYNTVMTGEEYKQEIMRMIKELNLKEYIEFTGVISEEEKKRLYKKAKIFYLPSKYETFGMVYVEAMASGTPIVAMKNSAVQYVVKDGVTGFLRNDEEGQKEAILRLLTDEKLYKEMQENCLKEAEKYRWENVIKKWERLIKELVEGKDVC